LSYNTNNLTGAKLECGGSYYGVSMECSRCNVGSTSAQRRDKVGTTYFEIGRKVVVFGRFSFLQASVSEEKVVLQIYAFYQ